MVSGPTLSEMSLQDAPSSGLQTQLEKAQSEGVQLRREVLRWKMLARQHEDRLKEIESSVSWRIFGVMRILPELRHRWKLLLLVGILACVSLPFWPLLAILMCFTPGRDLIWRVLWKIRPLHDLMGFVRQKILSGIGGSHGEVSEITPLIYHRPTDVESPATGMTNERLRWLLLQQLCPQRRILLQGYGLTRNTLIRDDETPDLLSLSRTEMSVLRISAGSHPAIGSGSVCSQ
jgi:hypothetical protein